METQISAQGGSYGTVPRAAPRAVRAGPNRIAIRALPRATALTAVAAVAASLLAYVVASALWAVPGNFAALNPPIIAVASAGGVLVAALGLALVARLIPRAARVVFVAVAIALTLLSLGGPFQAMSGTMPGLPAATTATGITMIVMHLITGGAIAFLLPALARVKRER